MKIFVSALAMMVSAHVACAPAQADLTLQQALRLSLQHNPQLGNYQFRRAALAGEKISAGLTPEMRLQLEAENLAGSDRHQGMDGAEVTLSFASILELGGQRDSRLAVATARQQQLASEQRVGLLEVVAAVNYRFIALLAAQEQTRVAEEARALAQRLVDNLVKRVQAGSTPQAELMRARAALTRSDIALEKARQQTRETALQLSAYWADVAPEINHARGDLFALTNPRNLADWQSRLARNPDLTLLADEIRLRAAELRRAESEGRTTVEWSAGIRRFQESNDTALMMSLNVPLASGKRATGAMQAARAEQDAARFAEDNAKTLLQNRLKQTFIAHQQAFREVRRLRDEVVPLLQEASRATTNAFEQGRYSSLELAMAQGELLSARADLITAALRAHETRIELERLTAAAEPLATEVTP